MPCITFNLHQFDFFFRLGFVTEKQFSHTKIYVPICNYNDEIGVKVQEYNETYCHPKAFQPTFNEYGMCFTFNNRRQGMDNFFHLNNSDSTISRDDALTQRNETEHKERGFEIPGKNTRKLFKVRYLVKNPNP